MGVVCDIWDSIWDAVEQVIVAIWNVVVWIVENILPALLIIGGAVVGFTAFLAIACPVAATALVNSLVALTTGIVSLTVTIVTGTFSLAVVAIEQFSVGFLTLLKIINFSAMLEIHELLMLISSDYRAMIAKLYDAISEVSEQLFGSTFALHLFFKNTKNLIASVGTVLGQDWDISELQYFIAMDEILVKFNAKAEEYMEDPETLLYDLEEWAEKNAVDIAGNWRRAQLEIFGGALEGLKSTAQDLHGFHNDFNAFKFGLPGERAKIIEKYTDPILNVLGDFHFNAYEKNRLDTDRMVRDNRNNLDRQRDIMLGIQWDTEKPSRSFRKIEDLPVDDRVLEEEIIEDYSSRELGRDNEELVKRHDERIKQEDAKKVRKELYLSPPSWETITEKPVTDLEMKKSRQRTSPFVGDY